MNTEPLHLRRVEPRALHWKSCAWKAGIFDTARRPFTAAVEGTIRTPDHMVLVTLSGGAEHLEVTTDCGHTYAGPERAGAVSFVPAHCERKLSMTGVCSEWASVAIRPELMGCGDDDEPTSKSLSLDVAPFSNVDDPFLASLVAELARLHAADGRLDEAYCEAMSHALAQYLARRYGRRRATGDASHAWTLPRWRVRRIAEYVEAHLGENILVADLASLVGVSAGHLHRAFRHTVGVTPLDYINERRIQRAVEILAMERPSVVELALRVGFLSPSHFTRTFRRVTGVNPSRYLQGRMDRSGASARIEASR
jgi:AraC family transcriptional regulator